jgi:hypothetical protein
MVEGNWQVESDQTTTDGDGDGDGDQPKPNMKCTPNITDGKKSESSSHYQSRLQQTSATRDTGRAEREPYLNAHTVHWQEGRRGRRHLSLDSA